MKSKGKSEPAGQSPGQEMLIHDQMPDGLDIQVKTAGEDIVIILHQYHLTLGAWAIDKDLNKRSVPIWLALDNQDNHRIQ